MFRPARLGVLLGVVLAWGCGAAAGVPKRRVIEADLEGWSFRRYQHVLDVEVFVPGNAAQAHTASYVRSAAERRGSLADGDIVSAFVTEYAGPKGVARALVRFARRLAQESGYAVDEARVGGQRVLGVAGHGEAWAFWSSGKYLVKVGGRGLAKVPAGLVEGYGTRYPSGVAAGALDAADEPEVAPASSPPKGRR